MSRKTVLIVCSVLVLWAVLLRWSLGSGGGGGGAEGDGEWDRVRQGSVLLYTTPVQPSGVLASSHPVPSPFPVEGALSTVSFSSSCVQRVQDSVAVWLSCVDASVAASAPSLKWQKKSPSSNPACSFRDYSAFDDPIVTQLFLSHAVEAHGDSTLREMLKLLVHGLHMAGSLDKKDASATLRSPKYFSRVFSNCSAGNGGIPLLLLLSHVSGKSGGGDHDVEHRRAAGVAQALWDAEALRGVDPVAFRIMFRFDFVPSSFAEPLRGTVPTLSVDDRRDSVCLGKQKTSVSGPSGLVSFFKRDASWRVLLLATGSHTAKSLLMNQSTNALAKRIVADKSSGDSQSFAADRIFEFIIADMEAYLLKRLLGLRVVRTPSTSTRLQQQEAGRGVEVQEEQQVRLVRVSGESRRHEPGDNTEDEDDDPALQPVQYALVFLEALECGKMGESNLQGFKDMAMFCGPMEQFLMKINHHILAHFSVGDRIRTTPTGLGWHRRSALWKLDAQQAIEFFSRLVVVPPLLCHDKGRHFQYSPTKPFCTRDGIHLRTRFIRLKLSLLFNIMSKMRSCTTNSSSNRLSW